MVLPVAAAEPTLAGLKPAVQEALYGIERFAADRGYRGWDPYDALNSPLLRALSLGLKMPRIAFTQALKVLPINLRPVLGIRPALNPKGLGLFLTGAVRRFRSGGEPRHGHRARWLAEQLLALRSEGGHGAGWGYPFPWQSRAFYVPRWTPTIVNTSFVALAPGGPAEGRGGRRAAELRRGTR